jgi:hypothetical protein
MQNKFDKLINYVIMNHQINEHREYIMNKFKLNDIVIANFDKFDDTKHIIIAYVDNIIDDKIISIADINTKKSIDEFYHDGTFAHSNDMIIRIKKINDEQLLRLINFDNE